MAAIVQPAPGNSPTVPTSSPPSSSTHHGSPPSTPSTQQVIEAQQASLADYLNQPVREILARLGITAPPAPQAPDPQEGPPPDPQASQAPGTPFDPMQLIQPVTDALGTLGAGLFETLDPTTILGGITQQLNSSGQTVQQALTGAADSWDGAAATEAQSATTTALNEGARVGQQAAELSESLATVTATVGQARARLIGIISEFVATTAAIGINIIFPWGMAAAIEAANLAVSRTTEVIAETQATLGAQAAQVTAAGARVTVTPVPGAAAVAAAPGSSFATTGVTSGLMSGLGPMLQLGSTAISPVMQGVSTATSAAVSAAATQPVTNAAARRTNDGDTRDEEREKAAGGPGGGPGGGVGGLVHSRLGPPVIAAALETTPAVAELSTPRAGMPATGGMPMMGAPMGHGARGATDGGHTAAQFLHTSDQGGEIVGELGTVGPSVIGERENNPKPNLELRV